MNKQTLACLHFSCVAALLLAACSSTPMQSARHPAGVASATVRNVTVVGMDERAQVRDAFENDVVALLASRGVQGTGSHARFGLTEMKGDKEQVRQRLLAAGAETVLYVQVTERGDFLSGPPISLGSMDEAAVDESRYDAFVRPGGSVNTKLRLGARLYRVSDGAVIWSGVRDEIMKEDDDPVVFVRKTAKAIVSAMAKDKVIP